MVRPSGATRTATISLSDERLDRDPRVMEGRPEALDDLARVQRTVNAIGLRWGRFTPHGHVLVVADHEGRLRLFDTATWTMQGMEVPSGVREPEAYIPSAAKPGEAGFWPPSSRAVAVEWARRARLRDGGLAVDDAALERVADAVMDAGPSLAAEARSDVLPPSLVNAVRNYLSRHPE